MKKVTIHYSNGYYGGKVEFTANEVFYKTEYWIKLIGYLPEGKRRKKWYPIGGEHDENNDYTGTIVEIEEV